MFRICAAVFLGFVLIVVESFIVMALKDYQTIEFGSIQQFIGVWAMNFFLVFAIMTDIMNWINTRYDSKIQL